ncbi:MAG: hypothetical protein HUJ76_10165, partial [Parasporobacterium sp.]|nr:hypothetical protein [Parasporobacterium sp.]
YLISSGNITLSENNELTKKEVGQLLKQYPLLLSDVFGNMDVNMPRRMFADNFGIDENDIEVILSGSLLSLPVQVSAGLGLSIGNRSSFFSIDPEIKMYKVRDTEDSYSKGLMFRRPAVNPYAKELIALTKEEEQMIRKG